MWQIDDTAVRRHWYTMTKASVAGANDKTAIEFDSWKYKHIELISSGSKNIKVGWKLCAGYKIFSTVTLSFLIKAMINYYYDWLLMILSSYLGNFFFWGLLVQY